MEQDKLAIGEKFADFLFPSLLVGTREIDSSRARLGQFFSWLADRQQRAHVAKRVPDHILVTTAGLGRGPCTLHGLMYVGLHAVLRERPEKEDGLSGVVGGVPDPYAVAPAPQEEKPAKGPRDTARDDSHTEHDFPRKEEVINEDRTRHHEQRSHEHIGDAQLRALAWQPASPYAVAPAPQEEQQAQEHRDDARDGGLPRRDYL